MDNSSETHFVKDYKPGTEAVVELKNGRFVDVANGRFYDQGVSVIIKDGKIVAMPGLEGESAEMKPDVSIDLQGKTVLPGLFNVHCHIQMVNPTVFSDLKTVKARKAHHDRQVEKNMADCLARGVTHIRDAFTDDLTPNRNLKNRILNGEIPGPRILQAVVVGARGGYLAPEFKGMKKILLGIMGLGKIEYEDENSGVVAFPIDANAQQVREAVDRAVDERGADLIKVGESLEQSLLNPNPIVMTMEQMQAITDQARRRGLQSTIHSVSVETFRRAVKAGFSSLAHMARDGELTREDVDICLKSDCIVEPTLSVGYDMSWRLEGDPYIDDPNMEKMYAFRNRTFSDLAAEFWVPELGDCVVAGFNKANLGKYKMLGLINLSKLLRHFSRLAHFGIENSKMLVEQGVTMACGNDGGVQACTPAMVAHELSIFDLFMNDAKTGKKFDEAAALRTATINSARSMGIDDEFGSIQTGKTADLAVVDGDPFQDFKVVGSRVAALFKGGCLVIDNCGLEI
ncbi:MAG: amidohydrolase family protein [Proteobacteria bacterium]|nr:amidohydrolase family protein [Pseudomonadota bacterium]